MKTIQPVNSPDIMKILADPRRLQILRLLLAAPATLTQLAQRLGQSPAWVRHHLLALETAALVELDHVRQRGKIREKYYRACAGGLLLQALILPAGEKPAVVFAGSHDLALEQVSADLAGHLALLALPVGSLDGLVNLRQGLCQISGTHLLDASGEYNTPFVRHLFPDREMVLVTLAHRTQGLIFAPGNPLAIRGVADLARPKVRFVNRNPGSGTRLWLDSELQRLGISARAVNGYDHVVNAHTACAEAVATGRADLALGLQAAAQQQQLGFLPLFVERYDLVLPAAQQSLLTPLLDHLQTAAFRKTAVALTGYNTTHSGSQVTVD